MIHVSGPRAWAVGLWRSRRCITLAAAAAMATILCGGVGAVDYADWWYCNSVEDFLDSRPYHANTSLVFEPLYLQWGRENGVRECRGEVLPEKRREALYAVYRVMRKKYLPDVVVAADAPDVGVKVVVGEPRVVMFAPEGNAADRDANIAKFPQLGGDGRWGQFMFPSIHKLRNGNLCIRVNVGSDDVRKADHLYYVSDDGGKNWRNYAMYDSAAEKPGTEVAVTLLSGDQVRGPEDGKQRIVDLAGLSLKTYDGHYRVGDLPKDLQWAPIFRRKAGEEGWLQEKAFWDPDRLIAIGKDNKAEMFTPVLQSWNRTTRLKDDSLLTAEWDYSVMADLGPDGKLTEKNHHLWRSFDGGLTWKHAADAPKQKWWPFRPDLDTVRAHILEFANGNWVVAYRHPGLYWSGGGPLIICKSNDQGKTWSKPKAIRVPGVNPRCLILGNGIGVLSYQRPGVFFTFCADGKGDAWGNDVTVVRATRGERDQLSCCNGSFLATGPDRFIYAYTKWDFPDPWGRHRQALIAQEFIVTRK